MFCNNFIFTECVARNVFSNNLIINDILQRVYFYGNYHGPGVILGQVLNMLVTVGT